MLRKAIGVSVLFQKGKTQATVLTDCTMLSIPGDLLQPSFSFRRKKDCANRDSQYTARPILVTKSLGAGVVLVRPIGLVTLEPQTLNW